VPLTYYWKGKEKLKNGSLFEMTLSLKSEKYRSAKKRVNESVLRYIYWQSFISYQYDVTTSFSHEFWLNILPGNESWPGLQGTNKVFISALPIEMTVLAMMTDLPPHISSFQNKSIYIYKSDCLYLCTYVPMYLCIYVPMSPFHARTARPISTKVCTDLPTNSGKVLNTIMTPPTQPPDLTPKLQTLSTYHGRKSFV